MQMHEDSFSYCKPSEQLLSFSFTKQTHVTHIHLSSSSIDSAKDK